VIGFAGHVCLVKWSKTGDVPFRDLKNGNFITFILRCIVSVNHRPQSPFLSFPFVCFLTDVLINLCNMYSGLLDWAIFYFGQFFENYSA
jgi:hypothetical protein